MFEHLKASQSCARACVCWVCLHEYRLCCLSCLPFVWYFLFILTHTHTHQLLLCQTYSKLSHSRAFSHLSLSGIGTVSSTQSPFSSAVAVCFYHSGASSCMFFFFLCAGDLVLGNAVNQRITIGDLLFWCCWWSCFCSKYFTENNI